MNPKLLHVRRGDLVLPAFRGLAEAFNESRLLSGRGILITKTANGCIINARHAVNGFRGAWYITLSGAFASVALGLVNGLTPHIDEVPIGGTKKESPPRLELDESVFDKSGRSWICLRVEVHEATGKLEGPTDDGELPKLTIVQRASPENSPGNVWYCPLAMLLRPADAKEGFGEVHQIAYFSYQHYTSPAPLGWRHHFTLA